MCVCVCVCCVCVCVSVCGISAPIYTRDTSRLYLYFPLQCIARESSCGRLKLNWSHVFLHTFIVLHFSHHCAHLLFSSLLHFLESYLILISTSSCYHDTTPHYTTLHYSTKQSDKKKSGFFYNAE